VPVINNINEFIFNLHIIQVKSFETDSNICTEKSMKYSKWLTKVLGKCQKVVEKLSFLPPGNRP
jgi:hypothetical protein